MPIFSQSFRICFLLAAGWAAAIVPLWLAAYAGSIDISGGYGALGWHAHELIFGYGSLVITGFLFTAIPNWTGRPPVGGPRLAALVALWVAGRFAIACADEVGFAAAALVDGIYLLAVIALAARELLSAGNRRNFVVVALVSLLFFANIWFHAEALLGIFGRAPLHAGIAVLVALIVLVGGRIVPNFTRNWLARQGVRKLPPPPSRLDRAAVLATPAALVCWIFAPDSAVTAVLAFVAALMLAIRLWCWRGWGTFGEPLLAILHIGYLFVPVGFVLLGAAILIPAIVPHDAALHAWTVGAVGIMTISVMTRASLGHTGHPLTASPATRAIYLLIAVAAVLRVAAPFVPPAHYLHLLSLAGGAWTLGFAGFVAFYGPMLFARRPDAGLTRGAVRAGQ